MITDTELPPMLQAINIANMQPKHNGTDTSRIAADSIVGVAGRLRAMVLEQVNCGGSKGATSYEICEATGLVPHSVAARLNELQQLGKVRDSGLRRLGPSGRPQRAYVKCELPPVPPKGKSEAVAALLRLRGKILAYYAARGGWQGSETTRVIEWIDEMVKE